ncbi:MAG: hypothetical protein Q9220_006591 [cf. Caloplaca sp. 1 TL-2023]
MSITRVASSRSPPLLIPLTTLKPASHSNDIAHNTNSILIDISCPIPFNPSKPTSSVYTLAHTHLFPPPPPSPLLTIAPNSPSLSEISLSSLTSQPNNSFASSTPSKEIHKANIIDLEAARRSPNIGDEDDTTSSTPPSWLYEPPNPPTTNINHLHPLSSIPSNNNTDQEDSMPHGWPYNSWRSYVFLALEYLGAMQKLLFGMMEQGCRWGGARHTI